MAKRGDLFGGSDAAAKARGEARQRLTSAATGAPARSGKTTITLSITEADKMKVKVYAMAHKTTVSDLLHGWIQEYCQDRGAERNAQR